MNIGKPINYSGNQSMRDLVWDSVYYSVNEAVYDSVWMKTRVPVINETRTSISSLIYDSVRNLTNIRL